MFFRATSPLLRGGSEQSPAGQRLTATHGHVSSLATEEPGPPRVGRRAIAIGKAAVMQVERTFQPVGSPHGLPPATSATRRTSRTAATRR